MGHLWPAKISKQQHYFRNKFVKYNKDPIWQACTVPVVLIDSATNKYFLVLKNEVYDLSLLMSWAKSLLY